jgi:ribosomal protein S12 methylthiotransferase RimO
LENVLIFVLFCNFLLFRYNREYNRLGNKMTNEKWKTNIAHRTVHLISLGCTKNLVDSEVMLGRLNGYKIIDEPEVADVIIVNTCGFIQSAKEESLNTILDMNDKRKKDSVLVMSGCLSERYKEELQADLKEVDIFTGVGDYDQIDVLVEEKRSQFSPRVFLADETLDRVVTGSNLHTYIKLSEGCNQTCAFCAIPGFKGKLNSRTIESTVKEVSNMVKNGYFDFTFVSQDSSSYLRDHKQNDGLEQLIDAIENIEGVKSARILYLYPSTTTVSLIHKIANSKVFHSYYDMPLQHSTKSMLKIMKRGKGVEKLKELMDAMRSVPDSFVRSTFIVGHPGETQEDFDALCTYVKEYEFDRANVFSYSDEEDTSAFDLLNKVDQETIDERADILGAIIQETTIKSLEKEVGKTFEVVVEKESDEHEYLLSARKLSWEREIDGEIYINDNELNQDIQFGNIYTVTVTEIIGDKLLAKVISNNSMYESDLIASQYCEFHYGNEYHKVSNFPKSISNLALQYVSQRTKALDIGCAVGRATFELAREFKEVEGIDYSKSFIDIANKMKKNKALSYLDVTEGELANKKTVTLESLALDDLDSTVNFYAQDAMNLDKSLNSYDLVIAVNLIDRLHTPLDFLNEIPNRMNKEGILLIASPYTWLEEFTKKENWLGGYIKDGIEVKTLEGLKSALLGEFELIDSEIPVDFVIKETDNKYQHSISQVSIWKKR